MPAIFIAGFLPMLLAAYAYRELNRVAPDCGTSFTWTTKAFGPYIGWMCGWGAVLATMIVLSNLAGVAVTFFYLFLGRAVRQCGDRRRWVTTRSSTSLTCLAFVAIATASPTAASPPPSGYSTCWSASRWPCWCCSSVMAFVQGRRATTGRRRFILGLAQPVHRARAERVRRRAVRSIFAFWGWDTCLTVNEESKDADRTPGRAALLAVVSILVTYLLVVDRGA